MTEVTKEPTKPQAGTGEQSVTGTNMGGSPLPLMESEPVDQQKAVAELAEKVQSTVPLTMSDEDALKVGRSVEERYLPPAPPPTVLEQVEAAKKKAASA